jgi:sugar/nucleoside kinase (ribokinase family)
MASERSFDCIVCGSCVVDVLARGVHLQQPIGAGNLVRTDPLVLTTGGIVSNSGITMARLGMRVAGFTYVGEDPWAQIIRQRYQEEGLDTVGLIPLAGESTSTSVVLIDEHGERSFLHAVGAPKKLDKRAFLDHLDLFRQSRAMLLGYYPLLPRLLPDLPEVLSALREVGCLTALDAAGDGGTLAELRPLLPLLDIYVPSRQEARHQTGCERPEEILAAYRAAGATGLLGIKLGSDGAVLSPQADQLVWIPAITPPGEVIDSTGAGDCFLGGLLTGLLRDLPLEAAGQLAAAAGACCVTQLGATAGIRTYDETLALAGRT